MKKKDDIKEQSNKSIHELNKEMFTLIQEIINLKLTIRINPPKDTNLLVKKKKKLAVILTRINQKQKS